MQNLLHDIQYAGRQMMKAPGFAVIAVLTLALGVGANTAIFSVVNAVLLEPLPYPDAGRLMVLFHHKPNFTHGSISYLNFLDWQRENRSFDATAAYRSTSAKLTGAGQPENLRGDMVSAGFFEILGLRPMLGRTFGADEDRLGANPTVMISEGLWKRKFASNPAIIGQVVVLDGVPRTIVGIIPASFQLDMWNFHARDFYVPIGEFREPQFRNRSSAWGTDALAHLKPGVTLAQAEQDMERVNRGLEAAYPDVDAGIETNIVPLKDLLVGEVRPVLWVLMGAVVFVLLIACVNVANLQLARSTSREREFAVRLALGAGRGRLIRQVLVESLALSFVGGLCGLLFAYWGAKAAVAAIPDMLPRAENVGLDGRVLLFTLVASVLAGVVFGVAPALRASRNQVSPTLNQSGRSLVSAAHRAQGVFVTVEMAMALVLLVGAGLMVRTLIRLWDVNPGFDPRGVIAFNVAPAESLAHQPPDAIRAAYRAMHDAMRSTPGVESVSFNDGAYPMRSDNEQVFWVEGSPHAEHTADLPLAVHYSVNAEYSQVMRLPLRRGRFISAGDTEHSPRVAVIDEHLAEHYFPGQNPIGRHLHFTQESSGGDRVDEIVGVVGHVKQFGLAPDKANNVEAEVYEAFAQHPDQGINLVGEGTRVFLRVAEGVKPESVFPSIRRRLQELDNQMVVDDLHPIQEYVDESIARQRFAMVLFSVFAAGALLLASIGIYGVLSYIVGQRTREIGIRMALGADKGAVRGVVLRDGARMTLPGIAIGLIAALGLVRLMSAMLFGVKPTDVLTFASVSGLLLLVALLACCIPAQRAAKLDPMQALRMD